MKTILSHDRQSGLELKSFTQSYQYIWGQATAVCFLYDTRLKFLVNGKDKGKGAPMSCAMIDWGKDYQKFFQVFLEFGAVVDL